MDEKRMGHSCGLRAEAARAAARRSHAAAIDGGYGGERRGQRCRRETTQDAPALSLSGLDSCTVAEIPGARGRCDAPAAVPQPAEPRRLRPTQSCANTSTRCARRAAATSSGGRHALKLFERGRLWPAKLLTNALFGYLRIGADARPLRCSAATAPPTLRGAGSAHATHTHCGISARLHAPS